MDQIVKGKKKRRPSKADLAHRDPDSDLRRSCRRRNVRCNIDYDDYLEDDEEFGEEKEDERRREKKLNLLLKLNQTKMEESSPTRVGESGRHAPDEGFSEEEERSEGKIAKKRRIINGGDEIKEEDDDEEEEVGNAFYAARDISDSERESVKCVPSPRSARIITENLFSFESERGRKGDSKELDSVPGTPSDSQSGVPLPDKKSLELILDKLQKKDTYGVYAEPVDPEELPDYHDIIEHPMDFATARQKLGNGSYSTLEQFESDIFLICSNAMQYNSPETIYYKQARSIQELARKKFLRLRIEIERSEKELKSEQMSKSNFLVKKQMKKPLNQTTQEPIGSDFSSGATLATARDVQNNSNPTQTGGFERPSDINGPVEGNASLIDTNLEKVEELLSGKGLQSKFGRKPFVLDDNRRATYNISNQPVVRSESIFTTFKGEIKQLIAVGLHAEYSYARSLARFAATLGPVTWKVASERIEQALPAGCKFGHGWVGEYEPLPTPVLMLENHSQKESALVSKLQCIADARKDYKTIKTSVSVKEHHVSQHTTDQKQFLVRPSGGPALEGKQSPFGSTGKNSITPDNATYKQQNLQSGNLAEPENKVSKQIELKSSPSANLNNPDIVAEKQVSSNSETAATWTRETSSRNIYRMPSIRFKQPGGNGVVAGGFQNGKVTSNSLDSSRKTSPSDVAPNRMSRVATCFPNGQEQGLTDPVQFTRIEAEKAHDQQKSSNQSPVGTPPVMPLVPSVRRDDSTNAAAAATHAWMSMGAGGLKQAAENSDMHKNQISADSVYKPTQELHPQTLQVQGGFPLYGAMQFQFEKNGFQPQALAPQPVRVGNEVQFQNRPMVFPQLVAADLSRFQVQSSWPALSPHSQPRQRHETLPPDLNIGFQSPGSPVKQSSGVMVDPQQPDLALQL